MRGREFESLPLLILLGVEGNIHCALYVPPNLWHIWHIIRAKSRNYVQTHVISPLRIGENHMTHTLTNQKTRNNTLG